MPHRVPTHRLAVIRAAQLEARRARHIEALRRVAAAGAARHLEGSPEKQEAPALAAPEASSTATGCEPDRGCTCNVA
jgi:hypothetical protein